MTIKFDNFKLFTLPNLLTSLNLTCGLLAIILSFVGLEYMVIGTFLIILASVFDFFDGFAARMLKSFSPIGKDLDSLADMVSFGLAPAVIAFHMFVKGRGMDIETFFSTSSHLIIIIYVLFPAMIAVFSALRLAKFNIDTRQGDSFIGLPTPANTIIFFSYPLILHYYPTFTEVHKLILNPWFLAFLCMIQSYLLISEFRMFSLKFKNFSFVNNKVRYIFLGGSLILLIIFKVIALPLIILLFIGISIILNFLADKNVSSKD